MKRKRRFIGPVVEIMLFALIISVICFLLNLIGANGYKTDAGTFETTLVVIKNIFILVLWLACDRLEYNKGISSFDGRKQTWKYVPASVL